MYILTMIRKNLPGKADYIMTAEHANGRPMTFPTEQAAMEHYSITFAGSSTFPVYAPKAIHVPA